tara:strand:+ start:859 stop:1359 length:501 start_codon:yes stop_codon:yes gene_type:complete
MQDHIKACVYIPLKCPCCADVIDREYTNIQKHFDEKHQVRYSSNQSTSSKSNIAYSCPMNDIDKHLTWKPQIALINMKNDDKIMILIQVKTTDNHFEISACHLNTPQQTQITGCIIQAWFPHSDHLFHCRIGALSKFVLKPYLEFRKSFCKSKESTMKLLVQVICF